jgi:hypothetical protein
MMANKVRAAMTAEQALAEARRLAAEGKVEIRNDAAKAGGRAVVAHAGHRKGVIVLEWSRPGVGFGALTLAVKDGRLVSDREAMGVQFCLDVLRQALEEGGEA